MNYRHAFHAGNFADVVKHLVLTQILLHLRKKETAFRVIDTHAGSALYDLAGPEASRSGEWREGIARLLDAKFPKAAQDIIGPYLKAVLSFNPPEKLRTYPGSPALVRHFLRPQDRLIACELEQGAATTLARRLDGDTRVKAIAIDGWIALSAYIPPKERRGLVLIDPPFEDKDEYTRLADALVKAAQKWPKGSYLAWYPIKDPKEVSAFSRKLAQDAPDNTLQMELIIAKPSDTTKLRGTGLIAINPPWTLQDEMRQVFPHLARLFASDGQGEVRIGAL